MNWKVWLINGPLAPLRNVLAHDDFLLMYLRGIAIAAVVLGLLWLAV